MLTSIEFPLIKHIDLKNILFTSVDQIVDDNTLFYRNLFEALSMIVNEHHDCIHKAVITLQTDQKTDGYLINKNNRIRISSQKQDVWLIDVFTNCDLLKIVKQLLKHKITFKFTDEIPGEIPLKSVTIVCFG